MTLWHYVLRWQQRRLHLHFAAFRGWNRIQCRINACGQLVSAELVTLKSLSCELLGSHVKYGASVRLCVCVCVLCIIPAGSLHQHVVKHLLERKLWTEHTITPLQQLCCQSLVLLIVHWNHLSHYMMLACTCEDSLYPLSVLSVPGRDMTTYNCTRVIYVCPENVCSFSRVGVASLASEPRAALEFKRCEIIRSPGLFPSLFPSITIVSAKWDLYHTQRSLLIQLPGVAADSQSTSLRALWVLAEPASQSSHWRLPHDEMVAFRRRRVWLAAE